MSNEEKSLAPEELEAPEAAAKELAPAEESAPPEEVALPEEAVLLGGGYASRIDLDYILGSSVHCFWAVVGSTSSYKWMNADQIRTIVQTAFIAPKVHIQYDSGSRQIQRIRPIKTF